MTGHLAKGYTPEQRNAITDHLHQHPGHALHYPAGHDFVLISTARIVDEHEYQHDNKPWMSRPARHDRADWRTVTTTSAEETALLPVRYGSPASDTFGLASLDEEYGYVLFRQYPDVQAYLEDVKDVLEWPGELSWEIINDDPETATAEVRFTGPLRFIEDMLAVIIASGKSDSTS